MPNTPNFQLPYPSLAGANDPPRDFQLLAEALDAALTQLAGDALGTGGVHVGSTDASGCVSVPHGLGVKPTKVTAVLGGNPLAPGSGPGNPGVADDKARDYLPSIYNITSTEIVVRLSNIQVGSTWAGPGVLVAVVWTARK